MAETGAIDAAAADKAQKRLPKFPKIEAESAYAGQKGFMLDMVKKELLRLGFNEQEINGGGLRVNTTFSKRAMTAAEDGVTEQKPEGKKDLHVAVASVQPGTGALRGFYAGQDYLECQINWATSGGSPGSSFKPFALAAGHQRGLLAQGHLPGQLAVRVPRRRQGPQRGRGPRRPATTTAPRST